MKRASIACVMMSGFSAAAAAQGYVYPLTHGQTYLTGQPSALPLVFQDRAGKPALELNAQGLSLRGRALCHWVTDTDPATYTQEVAANAVFDTHCPVDAPILATWGDNGTGAAAIFIRPEKQTAERVTVVFRGENFTIGRDRLNGFRPFHYDETVRPM